MNTIQLQISYFFDSEYKGNFEEFSIAIKKKLGDSIRSNYLPIDSNLPPELPRLELFYIGFKIIVSKLNISCVFENEDHFERNVEAFNSIYFADLKFGINRIGYVHVFFNASDLKNIFSIFNDKLSKLDFKEVSFRINTKLVKCEIECNNIEGVDFGAQIDINTNKQIQGFVIQRDLNTIVLPNAITPEKRLELIKEFKIEALIMKTKDYLNIQ